MGRHAVVFACANTILPLRLRQVQSLIGKLQQLGRSRLEGNVWKRRHPDTYTHANDSPTISKRYFETCDRLTYPLREPDRFRFSERSRQDHELFAPVAGQNIFNPNEALHLRAYCAEDRVAPTVAEPIVHGLEVIEVGDEYGEFNPMAPRVRNFREEPLAQVLSIVRARQPVARG